MSKEYDSTVISKEIKPVEPLAAAPEDPTVYTASSGDAMGSTALTRPDSEKITDKDGKEHTYNYASELPSATNNFADHLNTETGEIERLKDVKQSKQDMTEDGPYKQDHYVPKGPVQTSVGSAQPSMISLN